MARAHTRAHPSARARTRAHRWRHVSAGLPGVAYLASCIALCVACLSVAERLEKPTVARWDQADASMLMSCAEEPSSGNEPLWCADADSPHCTRGTPAPQSREPWFGPMFATFDVPFAVPLRAELLARATHNGAELLGYARADGERLERPPRRA